MPAVPLDLCLSTGEITDPLVRPGGRWVSGVHARTVGDVSVVSLRMWAIDTSATVDVLVDPVPLTGRGLSGGVHAWNHDGTALFVATRTAGVVKVTLSGDVVERVSQTPFDSSRSWSTPSVGKNPAELFAVADWTELWRASVGDAASDDHETRCEMVCGVSDGYLVDADGPGVRAMVWERPEMSWTTSRISSDVARSGVSVQQPRSTRSGSTRGCIRDDGGILNVVLEADDLSPIPTTIRDECEHAGPVWGPGQRSWCPSPDGRYVAYTRNERGFGSLWVYDRGTTRSTLLGRGVHGCLSWECDTLAAYRCGARTPPQVVAYDMSAIDSPIRAVVADPADARWHDDDFAREMVEPSLNEASSGDGTTIPYRLFRAAQPNGGIIVWLHGGPIDQWQVTFRPRHIYWLSRGWSIAVVDYRGTTGWGRGYVESLEGRWGESDAGDTVAVVERLHREHGFRPERTVLMGSSAGGLTALNAVRRAPSRWAGAVLSFPVVDLAEMMQGDDPFESHYMPRLIGANSVNDGIIGDRSPHRHGVELATTPMLVFHGDSDLSVPLVHSQRLADAVNDAGGSCRLVVLEGEGHGFSRRPNVEREFAETAQFLATIIDRDS